MALSAATTWECRTTGSDLSGGGFVTGASGTDLSQQDSAAFSGTDLVVDAVTSTKVSSVSHSFVATDVGNIIQVSAGGSWTLGFYQVVSVASGAATLDRSPAAVGTTGGTWALGGALATIGKALAFVITGNLIWIKSGTYSSNTSNVVSTSGIKISGYFAIRGDAPAGSNRPVIQATAGSIKLLGPSVANVVNNRYEYIILDGNGQSNITGFNHPDSRTSIRSCRAVNCATGFSSTATPIISSEAVNCTTGFSAGFMSACLATNCTTGFNLTTGISSAINCIANGGSLGFQLNLNSYVDGCIAYNTSSNGYSWFSAGFIANSIAVNCGGYGFNISDSYAAILQNCAGFNNTSGNFPTLSLTLVSGFISLTSSPFTNAPSGDFSLNSTAGGGAALKGAGIPGTFPGGLTTGYIDIGAAQSRGGIGTKRRVWGN